MGCVSVLSGHYFEVLCLYKVRLLKSIAFRFYLSNPARESQPAMLS